MSEDDAARARIAAMPPEHQADLYDAAAAAMTGIGVTKSAFLNNMSVLNAFNVAMRPAQLALEAAIAESPDQAVRDAKRRWEEAVETQRPGNQPPGRPLTDIERDRQEALRAYEEVIYASGDEHVIEMWRAYRDTLEIATDVYSRGLQ